jgi:hypothetical protein
MNFTRLDINYNRTFALECLEQNSFTITEDNDHDDFIDFARINDNTLKKYIREILDLPFPVEVMFFVNPADSVYKPHIDLSRKCAINFPINVPGQVWTAKDANNKYFKENNLGGKDEKFFPAINLENSHLYDETTMWDYPLLLNTSAPHSASNPNLERRFIISCSVFTHTYEQVKEIFSNRGQVNTL